MHSTGSSSPHFKNFDAEVGSLCLMVLDEMVHITVNNLVISCHSLNLLRECHLVIVLFYCSLFFSKDASAERDFLTSPPYKNIPLWSNLPLTCSFFCYSFHCSFNKLFYSFVTVVGIFAFSFCTCKEVKFKNAMIVAVEVFFRNSVLNQNYS